MTPLERSEIRRTVVRLAIPVVIQYSFRTVIFVVDQLMLGRVGPTALATMSIAGPIVHTMVSILTAFGVGTIALVSRATGERDPAKQAESSAASIVLSVVAGFAVFGLSLAAIPAAAAFFRVPDAPDVPGHVRAYLTYVAFALPFMMLEIAGSNILRAAGDTRTPMILALATNVVHIAANYVLIFGALGFPRMEVRGAGLSTAIALSFQGLLTAAVLFSKRSPVPLGLAALRLVKFESIRRLLKVTIPATIEPVVMQTGFLLSMKVLVLLGKLPLAAHRAAVTVESLSFMPGFGFSVACSALVGQYLGERRPDKAVAGFGESARFALYFMSLLGIAFLAMPQILIGFFAPGAPTVVALGAMCLAIAAFEQPFMAMAMVLGGALRGAGDTRSPILVGFLGVWCIRLPLTWFLAIHLGWGIAGAWATMVVDWGVRMAVFWALFRHGRWKSIQV